MKITYPKSFLKLLLIGFALAMLPLLVAFINANLYFGKLTKQSLSNLSQAVETTRASRVLMEELTIMERSARQYFVLHDKLLLSNYANAHKRFNGAIQALSLQPNTLAQLPQLQNVAKQETNLFSIISQAGEEVTFDQNIANSFADLSNKTTGIINKNNQIIDQESALFKTKIIKTQRLLFWQTLTLIPLSILIAGLITWMIARPIRRMDAAIEQLGKGNYAHSIEINGPGDLRQLGARLNWLRVELKDLQQQKQRFLQQASHELKTPLTAIREASELLHDGVGGTLNTQQTKIMHILRENSLRLQTMIENLLNYTKIQFNLTENHFNLPQLNPSLLALNTLIDEVILAYALSISQKNITLNQLVKNLSVKADKEKLQAVIDNLISNAVKFTPNGGEITIHAAQSKSTLTIEVQDTGPGVSEANKVNLFDPFYRGKTPDNSLVNGSGLGLFIAKEAACAMHAELDLLPSAQGARFVLLLHV